MASKESISRLETTLEEVADSLIERIPQAAVRSPENLWEELEMLDVILELKMKLSLA